MSELSEEKIAELIANSMAEHKKEKSWFMKLSWVSKTLMAIVAFGVAVSTLGTGVSWFLERVFHAEIKEYESLKERVYLINKNDSSIIEAVNANTKGLHEINKKNIEGASFFAVGYRAEKLPNGKIVRYYRDWKGEMHKIYPDPHYSTSTFTYWFFNSENGNKEYTFGK